MNKFFQKSQLVEVKGQNPPRKFIALCWFVGWWSLSLGISIDLVSPNIEIHLPFVFLRIGWKKLRTFTDPSPPVLKTVSRQPAAPPFRVDLQGNLKDSEGDLIDDDFLNGTLDFFNKKFP